MEPEVSPALDLRKPRLDRERIMVDLHSGEWSGFYEQHAGRHPQRMTLEFADGVVRGDGIDELSAFRLEGEYRVEAGGEVRIGWLKTYDRSHSILYLGTLDGEGRIVGSWRIGRVAAGSFSLEPMNERTGS
jgi:hypothetical protein